MLVSFIKQLTGNMYPFIPGTLGSDTGSSTLALSENVQVLFVRADNRDPSRVVNVFDNQGNKLYTIERQSGYRKHWVIKSQPDQRQTAVVTIGLLSRRVDREGPGSTSLRVTPGVLGKLHRYYSDSQGNLYIWSRRSLLLQQVANFGGGSGERRENVALARLLRPGRFDWELLIDDAKLDIITTLATAFITMKTQWLSNRLYSYHPPGARGYAPTLGQAETSRHDEFFDKPANISPELLVYHPKARTAGPTNFFNPPKFLEYKFTGRATDRA